MWIVKLGGSLNEDPALPDWLELLVRLGGGRVVVVCGGGRYADEVRRAQAHWQFNDLAAHNMAVLAMVQTAYQLHALNPGLRLAASLRDIRQVLHKGQTALWLPFEMQRDQPDRCTGWHHTSDSMALALAGGLNAERLVLVKSCPLDAERTPQALGEAGIVDGDFAQGASGADFPIEVLSRDEIERMRALLLGVAPGAALGASGEAGPMGRLQR